MQIFLKSVLPSLRTALFLFAGVVLLLAMPSAGAAESLPPKPTVLLLDDARLLSSEQAARLSAKLKQCEAQNGVRIYVAAFTLLQRPTLQQQTRELIGPWMGDEPALILAYYRGTLQSVVVMSPEMWRRYPSGDLVSTFDLAAKALVSTDQPDPAKRIIDGVDILVSSINKLEVERQVRSRFFTHDDAMLAAIFGIVLSVIAVVAMLAYRTMRLREKEFAVQYEFPQVEVTTRLGAPLGGGVFAEATVER
jgi:hypothetical protein